MPDELTQRLEGIDVDPVMVEYTRIECAAEEEWLEERTKSIGGSDAATVLGINPWSTPLQLWQRFRGLAPPKPQTEAMKMGKVMETTTDILVREMGRKFEDPGDFTIFRRSDRLWMHGTLDRIMAPVLEYDGPGVGEWKNVGEYMAEEWAEKPPLYVECQVQHNMACTGFEWGMIAAIIGGNKFVWFDVKRNDKFIAYLIEAEAKFWKNVEDGIQPKASAEDEEAVKRLFPEHTPGKIVVLTEEGVDLTGVRDECAVQLKALKLRDAGAKARLEQIIGTAEMATFPDGTPAWTFRTHFQKAYERKVEEKYVRTLRRKKSGKR